MKLLCSLAAVVALIVSGSSAMAGIWVNVGNIAPRAGSRSTLPHARVNRLAPVNSSYAKADPTRNDIWVVDTGNGLTSKNDIFAGPIRLLDAGKGQPTNGLQSTPDPNMQYDSVRPVQAAGMLISPGDGSRCLHDSLESEHNGFPKNFGPFFDLGGTADPGGTSF